MNYRESIQKTRLISDIETTITYGDVDYNGTAVEIGEKNSVELFHIVNDQNGELQILFVASKQNYRMPIDLFERIIEKAKGVVSIIDEK
jgi:hypothetical protein